MCRWLSPLTIILVIASAAQLPAFQRTRADERWKTLIHTALGFAFQYPPEWSPVVDVDGEAAILKDPAGREVLRVHFISPADAAKQGAAFCDTCVPIQLAGQDAWLNWRQQQALAEVPHPRYPDGGRLTLTLEVSSPLANRYFLLILASLRYLPQP